jgi:hypothetical protein
LTMETASRLYRAMNGEQWAQDCTSLEEVEGLHNADTFAEFLRINQIRDAEQVQRAI